MMSVKPVTGKRMDRREFLRTLTVALAATPFGMAPLKPAEAKPEFKYRYSDAHCHLVDFLQQTDGLRTLLRQADNAGVEHIQVMGLPVIKKRNARARHKPQYYLDNTDRCYYYSLTDLIVARQVVALPDSQRYRVHPFICGFNPTDKNCVDHILRMLDWFPGLWEGIGELLLHRAELSMLTDGEQARANHPALKPVYELAEERKLPVQIHSDMGVKALHEPVYLYEIEEAVAAFPGVRFIWCHAGYNRGLEIPSADSCVRRLVEAYPNLWIDLSWLVFENWICPSGNVNQEWLSLLSDYPDRFFVGSDKIGHFQQYGDAMRKYDLLMNRLPSEKAAMIARTNFLNLLGSSFK